MMVVAIVVSGFCLAWALGYRWTVLARQDKAISFIVLGLCLVFVAAAVLR